MKIQYVDTVLFQWEFKREIYKNFIRKEKISKRKNKEKGNEKKNEGNDKKKKLMELKHNWPGKNELSSI